MPASVKKKQLTLGYSPFEADDTVAPFDQFFHHSQDVKKEGFDGVDAVLLWGGRDIHPSFYGEKANIRNQAPMQPSDRDVFEWRTMLYCRAKKIPMIGICRGAQFLCAAAGGKLIQHVTNHQNSHRITTISGKTFMSTSVHHQMMYPYDVPHTLLAWADSPLSSCYYGEEGDNMVSNMWHKPEAEVVYFPGINGLAIQGHPEYGSATPEFKQFCVDSVRTYLFFPF